LDDFTGNFCGKGKYPLINAAVNTLRKPLIADLNDLNKYAMLEIAKQASNIPITILKPDTGEF